jgi:hypothetical protein
MNYTKPKNWPSLIRPGELKKVFDEFGNSDDFVNDLILYMQEDFARSTKERFLNKWNGVETINGKNFQVYRGISLTRESKRYEFFDRLLGDKLESSRYPIPLVNDQIQISFEDYSSWTRSHNIAKGYADAREGDIKVVLIAGSNDLKILANLFEIGDESDEVLAYPVEGLEVRFKAWRVETGLSESNINKPMKYIKLFEGWSSERELDNDQPIDQAPRVDLDSLSEKKKLKFHHSDAPDAKGRFKELGVNKLADWLIRTRGRNLQKITGSLNQQINFNKRKNPSYAKKMESTREAVKRKLGKNKK